MAWFDIRKRFFSIGAGGMLELSGRFKIQGDLTRLAETWSEAWLSETLLSTGLLVQDLLVTLGYLVLNLSTKFADAMTSFQNM